MFANMLLMTSSHFDKVGSLLSIRLGSIRRWNIRKTLPTEDLLENTDELLCPVLRPPSISQNPDEPTHQRTLEAAACPFLFLLTCILLVTSLRSKDDQVWGDTPWHRWQSMAPVR